MFKQSYLPVRTTTRFKKLCLFVDTNHNFLARQAYSKKVYIKKLQNGRAFSRRVQLQSKHLLQKLCFHEQFIFSAVIIGYDFYKPFYKELMLIKDFAGRFFYKPALDLYYPGFIFKNFSILQRHIYLEQFVGNTVVMQYIPYYVNFSHIFNFNNKQPSLVKATGCFAYKKRDPLRSKLMYVILPSGQWKYFVGTTQCYFGYVDSYKAEDFFFGSWGQCFRYKKKINVRGVAMNPIDHPNGGRAKAKQPERSPWGWTAKHNK